MGHSGIPHAGELLPGTPWAGYSADHADVVEKAISLVDASVAIDYQK